MLSAIQLPTFVQEHPAWYVAGTIVLLGLVIYGFPDWIRFRLRRAWAIASVVFAESIRRRVWMILPVAIAGVVVVSQLQKPFDEQDAIRQTMKFCLFAAGLVVTITAIILACTNLPKEIESRVIYTIVTKPTTRLEIVIGKVMGFACVSAAILLVMGVFTLGYMHLRAWNLGRYIATRLETEPADSLARPTLEHYREAGLLLSRVYENPADLQVYSRLPVPGDDRRWMFGAGDGQFVVPFRIPREMLVNPQDPNAPPAEVRIALFVGFEKTARALAVDAAEATSGKPTTLPYYLQSPDATAEQIRLPRVRQAYEPAGVTIEILDRNFNTLVDPGYLNVLPGRPTGGAPVMLSDTTGMKPVEVLVAPAGAVQMAQAPEQLVVVNGGSGAFEYFAGHTPVFIAVNGQIIEPIRDPRGTAERPLVLPIFRTRSGTFGQQIKGGAADEPVAVFKFRGADRIVPDAKGNVSFEMRSGIERSGDEEGNETPTRLEITVMPKAIAGDSGPTTRSAPTFVYPETNRTAFFTLPASSLGGGDFDLIVRNLTSGHFAGVAPSSVRLVTADESFAFNLLKSLTVLWLLSILVVIIAVFCSTFLSWPIAIVLTILMLLGRWGVEQLGDAIAPGIGNLVATDFGFNKRPEIARTVSATVEALTRTLNAVASVLPDISRFSALEDIERGVAVPMKRITESLGVIALFGLPLIVLAYVFLRRKEVAP